MIYFGRQSKKIVFFSEKTELEKWVKESWRRVEIPRKQASEVYGRGFERACKVELDREKVEPDPEYDALRKGIPRIVKQIRFNPYRDYNINYKGERF
jgi:hypothetical protein